MAIMPGRGVFLLSSLIFLLNLALSAPSHAGPATGSRTLFGADPELAEARRSMERGQERSAIRHARYTVRNSTRTRDRRDAYSILCAMHRVQGELELSLRACDSAVSLMRSDDWQILANRGQTLLLVERWEEGRESFQAAIEALDTRIRGSWRVPKNKTAQLAALHEQLEHARLGVTALSARQPVAALRR